MAALARDLEPMSIGDILDRTVRLYRRHFLHVLGIVALPYVLMIGAGVVGGLSAGAAAGPQAFRAPAAAAGMGLLVLAGIWLSFMSMGALARSISERYLGRSPGIGAAYGPVLRRTFSLAWAYFLSFLVWGGVLLAGIAIPLVVSTLVVLWNPGAWGMGIYAGFALLALAAAVTVTVVFFRLLLVTQVIVIENVRGRAALQRSWTLMRGNTWRAVLIFVFWVALTILMWVLLQVVVGFVAAALPVAVRAILVGLIGSVAQLLALPFVSVPFTLLYYDSRIRKEAFDLEVMAQNLGGAAAARPAPLPAAPPGPPGAFKTCPTCAAQVSPARPICPKCGTAVPFRPR